MTKMTEKQKAFRSTLLDRRFDDLAKSYKAYNFAEAVLISALPEPQTMAEASEQIDALKYGILTYAKAHQDWAQPILDSLQSKYGGEAPEIDTTFDAKFHRSDGTVGTVREQGNLTGTALRNAAATEIAS